MRKTMIILGAFTLLIAAPTFAQEKPQKAKTVKTENVRGEKVVLKKAQDPNEKLMVKPQRDPNETVEPKAVMKKNVREIKSVETRGQKSNTLIRKEENQ